MVLVGCLVLLFEGVRCLVEIDGIYVCCQIWHRSLSGRSTLGAYMHA